MEFSDEVAMATEQSSAERARAEAKTDVLRKSVYSGARTEKHDRPLVQIWQEIHENHLAWLRVPEGPLRHEDRQLFDASNRRNLSDLGAVPAQDWSALCDGIGWTLLGCVALSWCDAVEKGMVWEALRHVPPPFTATPGNIRACQFLNPAILPGTNLLSDLSLAAGKDSVVLSALIAACVDGIVLDRDAGTLSSANAQVASFLLRAKRVDHIREDLRVDLVTQWKRTVSGGVFDV